MLFRSTVNEYKDILDKIMLWDLFKIKLKELSSAYCKPRSKSKKTEVAIINDRFEQIEKNINRGNNTDKIKTERSELVGEFLVDIYNESISEGELCESQKRSV